MDKNFKVRLTVGVGMFIVALIALYTFDGIPFKVIFALFAVVAGVELISFFHQKFTILNAILGLIELGFLVGGSIFVARVSTADFWYIILGVCGYDIFAYLFGKMLGGKIFKKSRPFPHISKNKTWEGTILGLVSSLVMVVVLMSARGWDTVNHLYLLCGPLALMGDLYESLLKRRLGIKDSNEVVIKNPVFCRIEYLVGGSAGHGGFLDRIDSVAFSCTILLVLMLLV